jgi:hypothetical protein
MRLTLSVLSIVILTPALAQAPPAPPPAAASPPSVAPQAAPKRECTRLPLSDILFGRDATIASARQKLVEEYAPQIAKERGWKGFTVSNETASCEDYLYIPLLGQEYKCLVTATFCRKG